MYKAGYNATDHNQFGGKKWVPEDGQLKRERLRPSGAAGAPLTYVLM